MTWSTPPAMNSSGARSSLLKFTHVSWRPGSRLPGSDRCSDSRIAIVAGSASPYRLSWHETAGRRLCLGAAVGSGDPAQGLRLGERRRVGRFWTMGFEPGLFVRPPLRLARIEPRARIGLCRCPAGSPAWCQLRGLEVRMALSRWVGRAIGLDVHRDFCVVAICEDGRVRSAGRVPSTPEGLKLLAESLVESDRVALEVTGSCWEVARILEGHVDRVVVVSPDDTGISSARAKTDKLDARALASLLWRGELEAVWMPDERCRVLRRRLARREQ